MRRLLVGFSVVLLAAGVLTPAAAVAPSSTGAAPIAGTVVRTPADASGPAVTRYFGATRSDTAGLLARDGFVGADTILLARQDNFPDSLGGGFLAGQLGAPVVLTATDALSPEAQAVIDDVKPTNVVILGGLTAVSQAVQDALTGQGLTVTRLAGEGRYDTGAALATAPGTSVGMLDGKKTAILASGRNFPDALVMSALAYAKGWPLLLTEPGALVPQTSKVLTDLGIRRVLIAGGNVAVTPETAAAVAALGIEVTRLSGETRVDTGIAIASFAVAQAGLDPTTVNLATGRAFPDALALGPLAGSDPSPVLLTNGADDLGGTSIAAYLDGLTCVTGIRVSGGTGALSDSLVAGVRTRVMDADDCVTPSPSPTSSVSPSPSPSPSTPVCPDDAREDDDTRATATTITSGQVITGITCSDDVNATGFVDDWFTIDALPGQTISAVLEFDDSTSDLDLAVQDSRGFGDGIAGTSNTDNETDELLLDLDLQPPYLIRVTDVDKQGNDYTLTVTVTDPTCPADDVFEDNNTVGTATEIPPNVTLRAVTCVGDPQDLFIVFVAPGTVLDVTLDEDRPGADLDIYLEDQNFPVAQSTSGTATESIVEFISDGRPQPLILAVESRDGGAGAYTLTLANREANCTSDDASEPNDTQATAASLLPPATIVGVVCAEDPQDWFEFEAAPGQVVDVGLTFDTNLPNELDVYLVDGAGDTAEFSVNEGADAISYEVGDAPGPFAVYVNARADGRTPYELTVELRGRACPSEDQGEDDDNALQANPLGALGRLRVLCPQTDTQGAGGIPQDWYVIEAGDGQTITVVVDALTARSDIQVHLFDSDVAPLDSDTTSAGHAEIVHQVDVNEGGVYYVRVQTTGAAANYVVSAAVADPTCDTDDVFEPNDSRGAAVPVPLGERFPAVICSGNDDWYQVTAGLDEAIRFQAFFVHSLGDIDVQIVDGDGILVKSSTTVTDNEDATYFLPDDASGTYFIRVYGFAFGGGASNNYDVQLDVIPLSCPTDDRYEENDNQAQAEESVITAGLVVFNGIYCDDLDVFAFSGGSNEDLSFTVRFDHDAADLRLFMRNSVGDEVDFSNSSSSGNGVESVEYHVPDGQGQTYHVVIDGPVGLEVEYEVTYAREEVISPPP